MPCGLLVNCSEKCNAREGAQGGGGGVTARGQRGSEGKATTELQRQKLGAVRGKRGECAVTGTGAMEEKSERMCPPGREAGMHGRRRGSQEGEHTCQAGVAAGRGIRPARATGSVLPCRRGHRGAASAAPRTAAGCAQSRRPSAAARAKQSRCTGHVGGQDAARSELQLGGGEGGNGSVLHGA